MAAVSGSGDAADSLELAVARERRLWDAFQSNDVETLRDLIDADACDVGPAGVLSRSEVLGAVAKMHISSYTLESPTLLALGEVEILTYRSTVDGTYDGRPFPARAVLNTSVWVESASGRRLVHRQETPVRRTLD